MWSNSRLARDVREATIAVVSEKPVGDRPVDGRHAVVQLSGGREATPVSRYGEVNVIGYKKIKIAVLVVVKKGSAGTPSLVVYSRILRDIRKGPVTIIPVENIGAEVGEIEIGKPVVIVITNCYSHSISGILKACLLCNIDETQLSFGDQFIPV